MIFKVPWSTSPRMRGDGIRKLAMTNMDKDAEQNITHGDSRNAKLTEAHDMAAAYMDSQPLWLPEIVQAS